MDENQIPVLEIRNLQVLWVLGHGARGVVFLVRDKSSNGELFALKTILRASVTNKLKITNSECEQISFEQEVLRISQHPLLPKLRGVLSTDKIIGYAIDYCPGRDLNHLRKKQTERLFSVDTIRFYAAELVLALEYLHGLKIVYRDLKPENILIQENGHLMLVDFDLSKKLCPKLSRLTENVTPLRKIEFSQKKTHGFLVCCGSSIPLKDSVHPDESVHNSETSFLKSNSFVGTEEYVAPEMLENNGHDFTVDWWCLGIVLHEMLYGTTPFKGKNRKMTFYNILNKTLEIVGEPTPLRDLIRKLLVKDPKWRISTAEIKGHEFFRGVDWVNVMEIDRPPFVPGPLDLNGMDVNNIDVEAFVEGLFRVSDDVHEKEEGHDFLIF
ncbi:serine/threonine-protein kinase OXI1-like [Rutidosis leptorrhynchoides]|uniref:serine/threonine-protein kinase OXI1-like n=1 Tax=Rutidosis leptorrhynchoides TaxID=125765 RepID=UPI003A994B93